MLLSLSLKISSKQNSLRILKIFKMKLKKEKNRRKKNRVQVKKKKVKILKMKGMTKLISKNKSTKLKKKISKY